MLLQTTDGDTASLTSHERQHDDLNRLEVRTMHLQALVGELLVKNQKLREELSRLRLGHMDAVD